MGLVLSGDLRQGPYRVYRILTDLSLSLSFSLSFSLSLRHRVQSCYGAHPDFYLIVSKLAALRLVPRSRKPGTKYLILHTPSSFVLKRRWKPAVLCLEFEVFAEWNVNLTVFWDVTPCSWVLKYTCTKVHCIIYRKIIMFTLCTYMYILILWEFLLNFSLCYA
jgi:hypothetical protein